jgi:hypothetical protein
MIKGGAEWLHMGKYLIDSIFCYLNKIMLLPSRCHGWVRQCVSETSITCIDLNNDCIISHFVPNITMGKTLIFIQAKRGLIKDIWTSSN